MENAVITARVIEKVCNGKLLTKGNNSELLNFEIDTRKINVGAMFVAIKGEKVDGNDFVIDALEKGAIGCLTEADISENILEKYQDRNIIKVEDSIKALQQLARYKRSLYDIPVVAITGSVGKTSTKDIIATVMSEGYKVLKTEGNFNNHLGLPITLLKLQDHTAVVIEMGMNHLGEISLLTDIAKPTIAVITNIGTSHIGILKSRENILKAKLEILEGLKKDGVIIINNDNDLLNNWAKDNNNYNICTYGIENKSDINAGNIKQEDEYMTFNLDNTDEEIKIYMRGSHFILNSLAAIKIGTLLGIDKEKIYKSLENIQMTSRRMKKYVIKNNITILDDTYNASYESIKAALEYISKTNANRKIAVLGDVLELGEFSKEMHLKIGEEVSKNNIDILITVGTVAKYIAQKAKELNVKEIYAYETTEQAIQKLEDIIEENDIILVKASNGMKFDNIINSIVK